LQENSLRPGRGGKAWSGKRKRGQEGRERPRKKKTIGLITIIRRKAEKKRGGKKRTKKNRKK